MAELIYSVESIFGDYLLNEKFKSQGLLYNIPEYQRGYKWSKNSVRKLLIDINNFKIDGEKFYCLQNITIVNKIIQNKFGENIRVYNIVDGQQRLTTLTVLLSYLEKEEIVKDKLNYSIRTDTQDFISEYILTRRIWSEQQFNSLESFKVWQGLDINKKWNHQDVYYLFNASLTIKRWFVENEQPTEKREGIDKEGFLIKLLKSVKLIVNKLDQSNEEKIFGNLNSKQVFLNGADLIRAILITRVAQEETNNDLTTKSIVKINERRARIGWELDEINCWWNQTKKYFNRFITIKEREENISLFNSDECPINYLFKLYAESINAPEISLDIFEYGNDIDGIKGNDHIEMYKGIIKLHKTLQDWFQDRVIYHYLGFLVSYKNNFRFKSDIWDLWTEKVTTRKEFEYSLKLLIKDTVFGSEPNEKNRNTGLSFWLSQIRDTKSYDWYENEQGKLSQILILLDIIKLTDEKEVMKNPLPYLDSDYFKNKNEDKEHIFPQTPISEKDNSNIVVLKNKLKKYIDLLSYYAKDNKLSEPDNIVGLYEKWIHTNNEDKKLELRNELKTQMNEFLATIIDINSIGNIVLLDFSINRSYGNDFYTDKRHEIIKNSEEAKYIRPHTLTSFTKTFASNEKNLNHWGQTDIVANANDIANKLEIFFKNTTDAK